MILLKDFQAAKYDWEGIDFILTQWGTDERLVVHMQTPEGTYRDGNLTKRFIRKAAQVLEAEARKRWPEDKDLSQIAHTLPTIFIL